VNAARGDWRIVLNAGWLGANTPVNAGQRAQFCGYVRSTLVRNPQIHDVVIWNEATSVLPRGNDNPRAISNVSLSPVTFIGELGRAYRVSGRRKPIFDTWGQNVYGASSLEPVSKRHAGGTISQGDYGKLLATIKAAFRRTGQLLPSANGRVRIWYLETGFQTGVDGAAPGLYQGEGNVPVLSPVAQARQLSAAIKLAYCQPAVEALFNFQLADDPALGRVAVRPSLGRLDAETVVSGGA
jgi:hypothetical protein